VSLPLLEPGIPEHIRRTIINSAPVSLFENSSWGDDRMRALTTSRKQPTQQPLRRSRRDRQLRQLLVAALITAACFIWTYARIGIVYYINDDVGMQRIASGSMTGVSDAHLIYIKYVLGWVISGLYRAETGVDWYGLTMLGFMYGCLALILFRALQFASTIRQQGIVVTAVVVGYLLVCLPSVAQFQFTTVAGWLAGTGIFWLCTSAPRSQAGRVIDTATCFLLLVASYAVRSNVFIMSLPFVGLAFLYSRRESQNRTTLSALLPAFLLVGVGAVQLVEQAAYRDPAWRAYLTFDAMDTRIYDYCGLPAYAEHQAFYRSIGVSSATYNLLTNWIFVPNSSADSQTFQAIVAKCNELRAAASSSTPLFSQLYGLTHDVLSIILVRQHAVLNLAFLGILIGVLAHTRQQGGRLEAVVVLSCVVIFLGEWFYLVHNGRYPERVIWVLYFMGAVFLAGMTLASPGGLRLSGEGVARLLVGLAAALVLGGAIAYQTEIARKAVQAQAATNRECAKVMAYIADHPENYYFLSTLSFADCTQTFAVPAHTGPANFTFMGGWDYFSPLLLSNWNSHGISDVQQDLVKKDRMLLLVRPPDTIEYVVDYYRSIGVHAVAMDVDGLDAGDGSQDVTVFSLKVPVDSTQ
jgi:hypothetical protein